MYPSLLPKLANYTASLLHWPVVGIRLRTPKGKVTVSWNGTVLVLRKFIPKIQVAFEAFPRLRFDDFDQGMPVGQECQFQPVRSAG